MRNIGTVAYHDHPLYINSHGRTASYPSRPHTDPDVRNYRIRLLNNIIARVTHKPLNTNPLRFVASTRAVVRSENSLTYPLTLAS